MACGCAFGKGVAEVMRTRALLEVANRVMDRAIPITIHAQLRDVASLLRLLNSPFLFLFPSPDAPYATWYSHYVTGARAADIHRISFRSLFTQVCMLAQHRDVVSVCFFRAEFFR